jgi:hypothetical protein
MPTDAVQIMLNRCTPTSMLMHIGIAWKDQEVQTRNLSVEFVEYVQKALALYHPAICVTRGKAPYELVITCPFPGLLGVDLQESLRRWLEADSLSYAFDSVRAICTPATCLSTMSASSPWKLTPTSVLQVWVKDLGVMERIAKYKRVKTHDGVLDDIHAAGGMMPFPWQISVVGVDSIYRVLNRCGRVLLGFVPPVGLVPPAQGQDSRVHDGCRPTNINPQQENYGNPWDLKDTDW